MQHPQHLSREGDRRAPFFAPARHRLARDLIRARTSEGRELGKAQVVKLACKPKLIEHQKREAIRRRDHDGEPACEIARSHSATSRITA
jgi:hypothetical protein